jgi:hypothetical protein
MHLKEHIFLSNWIPTVSVVRPICFGALVDIRIMFFFDFIDLHFVRSLREPTWRTLILVE